MKRELLLAILGSVLLAGASFAEETGANLPTLSDDEAKAGWKLLFDGVSFNGWRGLGMDEVPQCWTIDNGCLKCLGGHKGVADLITVDKYDNFEFAFEWRFPKKKGNSGVKYRVEEQREKGYAFGCEYQCILPDKSDENSTGSLYDLFAPQGKKLAPEGEFNQARIVVQGNHLEHWLNGVKVVEAEFGSEAMEAALAKSYFKKSNWGKTPLGHIALQNHHSEVLFRNLKIRVLTPAAEK